MYSFISRDEKQLSLFYTREKIKNRCMLLFEFPEDVFLIWTMLSADDNKFLVFFLKKTYWDKKWLMGSFYSNFSKKTIWVSKHFFISLFIFEKNEVFRFFQVKNGFFQKRSQWRCFFVAKWLYVIQDRKSGETFLVLNLETFSF